MNKYIKKYLLLCFGLFFVALGLIGAFLPILPTTPFLILALTCFANSSPRFHQMLLNNRWFGPALQQWENSRSLSRASKHKALILIIISFSLSITILYGRLYLQLGLLVLGSILIVIIWHLKEAEGIPAPPFDN